MNNSGNNPIPLGASSEHPYNRYRFKYVPCERDPIFAGMIYRQSTNPSGMPGVRLCREDMSPYMVMGETRRSITTEKGFRTVRANCGVREGRWYYEVTINRGGEPTVDGHDGAHVRLGWARREATLQAPVGFDAYSYGIRDTTGESVHMSKVSHFGAEPFKTGDVIGMYISIPPDGNQNMFFKNRRLRKPFSFKGQLYYESTDYSPTTPYIEMAEYEATPSKENLPVPPCPAIFPGSKIIVYKNGVCQGVMCNDLLALLPIEKNAKEKEQIRFDDGTLGYYPAISVYRGGLATANFGPDFKFPPSSDPEAEAEGRQHHDRASPKSARTWRPMSERWDELLVEESLIDLVDEVELWASLQGDDDDSITVTTLRARSSKKGTAASKRKNRKLNSSSLQHEVGSQAGETPRSGDVEETSLQSQDTTADEGGGDDNDDVEMESAVEDEDGRGRGSIKNGGDDGDGQRRSDSVDDLQMDEDMQTDEAMLYSRQEDDEEDDEHEEDEYASSHVGGGDEDEEDEEDEDDIETDVNSPSSKSYN